MATFAYHQWDIAPLAYLTLAYENNLGAWWSGMLLFTGAIHAFDGVWRWTRARRRVALGWAALSLVLLILSLDEIGSLHERAEQFLPGGAWLSVLPFVLVVLALFAFAVVSLGSSRDHRRSVLLIVLALLCLGGTAFLEYLEEDTAWGDNLPNSVIRSLEEGSELVAMLLFIAASLPNTGGIFRRGAGPREPVLEAPFAWRRYALPLALISAPILAYVSAWWLLDHRGHPVAWLAAGLYFLAAVAALHPILRTGAWRSRRWHWALAGSALLASAASVTLNNMLPYVLAALSLLIMAAWLFLPSVWGTGRRLLAAGALLGVTVAMLVVKDSFMLWLVPALGGVLVYGVTAALVSQRVPERRWLERVELVAKESQRR